MKTDDSDQSLKHDPLDQNFDENAQADEEFEFGADTDAVEAAEDAALNSDNDTARLASKNTEAEEKKEAIEKDIADFDEELQADEEEEKEQKHKNRESTAEKAKRSTRQSTSEKAKIAIEEKKKSLDPLRLRGKKYRASVALVDKTKIYSAEEAIEMVKQTAIATFDSSVEVHVKVKGEAVRGTVVLPHGNGKTRKVAIATDDVIEAIAGGTIDFDVLLATPAQMPKLAKYAKVLGPKGLMPSPKAGTVTENPDSVIAEISGGRVEYRADKGGVVHLSIGKVSFATPQIAENFAAVLLALVNAKIQSISMASTMGPGVKVAQS